MQLCPKWPVRRGTGGSTARDSFECRPSRRPDDLRNSVHLLGRALFAAFGSMYFAVISMSDADHRRQFFAPIIDEVERTLAVRAVYLAIRQTS